MEQCKECAEMINECSCSAGDKRYIVELKAQVAFLSDVIELAAQEAYRSEVVDTGMVGLIPCLEGEWIEYQIGDWSFTIEAKAKEVV